jgi:hypothetical protein
MDRAGVRANTAQSDQAVKLINGFQKDRILKSRGGRTDWRRATTRTFRPADLLDGLLVAVGSVLFHEFGEVAPTHFRAIGVISLHPNDRTLADAKGAEFLPIFGDGELDVGISDGT